MWDPAEQAWEETLAAARAYYAEHGTLAALVTAAALDKPVGQWLANVRKDGGLGMDPERARRRAEQLAVIDPDWRPAWRWAGSVTPPGWPGPLAMGAGAGGDGAGRGVGRGRRAPGGCSGSGSMWCGRAWPRGSVSAWRPSASRPCRPERKTPARASRGGSAAFERGCAASGAVPGAYGRHGARQPFPRRGSAGRGRDQIRCPTPRPGRPSCTAQLQTLAGLGLEWAEQALDAM
ncbi:helicase associated domain-containing protein [Streptomyces cinerochromogenes]|uniref:helicase associated domain-containing protein n=1 Tax=Streptomyces cinerochromogenes TaxID=66422 RepID=UPI0033BA100C